MFLDKTVFDQHSVETSQHARFSLNSGYKDSMGIIQKMTSISYDYSKYELNQEMKIRMADAKSFDLMKEFKDSAAPPEVNKTIDTLDKRASSLL
jgi:hypothetical protein